MGLNLLYAQVSAAQAGGGVPLAVLGPGAASSLFWAAPDWPAPPQTVSDIERGWILVNKEQHRQLKSLQEKVSKKEVGTAMAIRVVSS